MKILHLGNPYFRQDFESLGHDVKHVGIDSQADVCLEIVPIPPQTLWGRLPEGWRPDLVVVGDHSGQPLVAGLEFLDVPLVWYAIDSHLHLSWHRHYAATFDIVLVAQRGYVDEYRVDATRQVVEWMPVFCDSRIDRRLDLVRDIPLSFVGTLNARWNPERVRLIEAVQARMPIAVQTGPYVEMFNRSQMVLNQCAADEINFRTMQAMACGAVLLMPRVGHGFADLFEEGTHCLLYEKGDADQVIELVTRYRSDAEARARLAESGYEAVQAAHTSLHRTRRILELVASHDLPSMVRARRGKLLVIQGRLAAVYEASARKYRTAAADQTAGSRAQILQQEVADRYHSLADSIRRELRPFLTSPGS